MLFIHRLVTLIAAILFVPSSINTVLQFKDYIKKMKILRKNKDAEHPLKTPFFQSLVITGVLFIVFYLFGGIGFIHSYLYPISEKKTSTTDDSIKNKKADSEILKSNKIKKETIYVTEKLPLFKPKTKALNKEVANNTTKKDTQYKAKIIVAAPNYGNQQNGDHNIMVLKEPYLTDKLKADIINQIEIKKKELGIKSDSLNMEISSRSNAAKLYNDIKEFLLTKGYKIAGEGVVNSNIPINGIEYSKGLMGYLNVTVGLISK